MARTRPVACSAAPPARPASPSARAPRCSTPGCRPTRPSPSSPTWPKASAPARPPGSPACTRTRSPATSASPAATPSSCTTSSSHFPPATPEAQFDEQWSFVERKEKHCQPEDARRGDCWDHTALDPESRLVVSLVVGKRTAEAAAEVVGDFHRRTGGRVMRLMTSDEYSAYVDAIRATYGTTVVPERTGRPGRPR